MILKSERLLFEDEWFAIDDLSDLAPQLLVIVDTEEEFDWAAPFDRGSTGVQSIRWQSLLRELYRGFGVRPTYVVDYPVASQPAGYEPLRELQQSGECLIGAHLQPWVNIPHEEELNEFNSYPGNLPAALERRKLECLTEIITQNFGKAPVVYKAGRYGLGPRTFGTLAELGYKVDLSPVPYYDLRERHGPDFRKIRPCPYWIGKIGDILTIPLSWDFYGQLAQFGLALDRFLDRKVPSTLLMRGLLSRLHLLERSTLTPEGVSSDEYIRLVEDMIRCGHPIFSLTYHSPSLEPGHTPYVRTPADLRRFIKGIEKFLNVFMNRFGGKPADPLSLRNLLLQRLPRS
ncbi:MAG: hypothetical protein EXR08_03225 [Alphaproteobacteria bacterium]|nr:hypothetical protein [Alphaproteobacteria bacterium]